MDNQTFNKRKYKLELKLEEYGSDDEYQTGKVADVFKQATSTGSSTFVGIKTITLQSAMDNYASILNQSAIAKSTGLPVRTASAQYKGFAAEEYFKNTTKINALASGVNDWEIGIYTKGELPDGSTLSGIDTKVDISIWTRKSPWNKPLKNKEYQSKIHNNASAYKKDMENLKYKDVEFVGGAGQGVNDTVKVSLRGKDIQSDSITPEEAKKLADSMKAQKVQKYNKSTEKHKELNKVNLNNAVLTGAFTGLFMSTVTEIFDIIKNDKEITEEQFTESFKIILCGATDGGVRGGAILGSVQALGKMLGREIPATSLTAVHTMTFANTAVDLAKDIYNCFFNRAIDADDLLCNTVSNFYKSFTNFGGAYATRHLLNTVVFKGAVNYASFETSAVVGASIGSALGPVGTVLGATIGSIIIGQSTNVIVDSANKDAIEKFAETIDDIKYQFELSGNVDMYYFANSMSSISEYKLSFKNLLPCYNLISDLKEYSLHKKALKDLENRIEQGYQNAEKDKEEDLQALHSQHKEKLQELTNRFYEQRDIMRSEFKSSFDTYVSNSYTQYIDLIDIMNNDMDSIMDSLNFEIKKHSSIISYAKNRNKLNLELNIMLDELMKDTMDSKVVAPFVGKMIRFMEEDKLIISKQYISQKEAMYLTNGVG